MLAVMYEKGLGVERNADEAARWRALAEEGDGPSAATS